MTGAGLQTALHAIADLIDEAERVAPERKGFVLHRPLGPTFVIEREGAAWRVEGIAAERAVGFADLTIPEAAEMAARRLARLGVDDALIAAGAVAGDEVRIGDLSFEFVPDLGEEEDPQWSLDETWIALRRSPKPWLGRLSAQRSDRPGRLSRRPTRQADPGRRTSGCRQDGARQGAGQGHRARADPAPVLRGSR